MTGLSLLEVREVGKNVQRPSIQLQSDLPRSVIFVQAQTRQVHETTETVV